MCSTCCLNIIKQQKTDTKARHEDDEVGEGEGMHKKKNETMKREKISLPKDESLIVSKREQTLRGSPFWL